MRKYKRINAGGLGDLSVALMPKSGRWTDVEDDDWVPIADNILGTIFFGQDDFGIMTFKSEVVSIGDHVLDMIMGASLSFIPDYTVSHIDNSTGEVNRIVRITSKMGNEGTQKNPTFYFNNGEVRSKFLFKELSDSEFVTIGLEIRAGDPKIKNVSAVEIVTGNKTK